MRFLLVALVALGLAACDLGASSPSAEPLPSVGLESMDHSMAPGESMGSSASASADASGETAMTCAEAFDALNVTDIAPMTDLDTASEGLDETIAACANVAEWQAALTTLVPSLNLDGAEAFLAARCDSSDLLSDAPICDEVDD
jgi:hypothetical protein